MNLHDRDIIRKAKSEGITEGREEKSIETAENMIRKEYPFDEIVEITGLALEKVKELAESITVKV